MKRQQLVPDGSTTLAKNNSVNFTESLAEQCGGDLRVNQIIEEEKSCNLSVGEVLSGDI